MGNKVDTTEMTDLVGRKFNLSVADGIATYVVTNETRQNGTWVKLYLQPDGYGSEQFYYNTILRAYGDWIHINALRNLLG